MSVFLKALSMVESHVQHPKIKCPNVGAGRRECLLETFEIDRKQLKLTADEVLTIWSLLESF